MDSTARGKGYERVEEATRMVWVHQIVVATTTRMEVRQEGQDE